MKFIFKSIMYIVMVWVKLDNFLNKNFIVFVILVLKLYLFKIVRFFFIVYLFNDWGFWEMESCDYCSNRKCL